MAQIFISLGSNVEREKHTYSGLDALHHTFGDLQLSSLYESEAVGFAGSAFFNMVICAYTQLSVEEVVNHLKAIERQNGRLQGDKKFAPRTLDLDLLLYDDLVLSNPVELPRAEVLYNAFVLWPLAELVPKKLHPVTQISYEQLWQDYNKDSQKLWKVDFNWKPSL
ncbi:2-amino-4-hydroxy-6-hydroxymethyldihydropteridine diphosphokinase [Bowmanella yangjiangensis]|uniref:2-amino-4-hydroxy-6-hydroxymethyldihydropteridine diphosphokinase n=1 Tax=Bowmanella yangjiangensis TaxID=2811230 RepID=A0ABS3CV78_9ALTE|nr:2-amino-4-hydroxy-6-hydroxymethyldihydropteridine diphosphokinase [Bowmanella yangjiangensis]MBN7820331.1 2-amino-4-hydroxy-6-hydroxymethyldihydropteridine diphosphokinase [Bowmanella yangjiangensis]